LRKNPMVKTCYAFGDALHVTLKAEEQKGKKIENSLKSDFQKTTLVTEESYGLTDLRVYGLKEIKPTIEDCYMNLSQNVTH